MREKLVLIAVVFLIVGFGWYILDFELEKLTRPSSDAVVDIRKSDDRDDVDEPVDDVGENKVEVELDGVEHVVKVNAYTGEVISHEVD